MGWSPTSYNLIFLSNLLTTNQEEMEFNQVINIFSRWFSYYKCQMVVGFLVFANSQKEKSRQPFTKAWKL
jgi:hypothetical protein